MVDGTWNRVGCWLDVAVVLKPVSSSSDVHLSFAVVLMVEKVLLGVLQTNGGGIIHIYS
jgi:hypothetical protein